MLLRFDSYLTFLAPAFIAQPCETIVKRGSLISGEGQCVESLVSIRLIVKYEHDNEGFFTSVVDRVEYT